ncbi:MAG: peptidase [Cyanomargarita calcarea GSE-NOS-MK-12-04C]|uniref:Peptidase n=1 Tax=Cyanomargarita calcarea GSE-NOS-MK-12-04C TaxID=2839659 RepID=A0A951UUJ3_9CYAN|nr:peptidase [Cyanomargarita calcarea GSE-NOS-MK-12-04C]
MLPLPAFTRYFWVGRVLVRQLIAALTLAICTGLLVIFINGQSFAILPHSTNGLTKNTIYSIGKVSISVSQKPHSLPHTLAKWQDNRNSGDYFSQIAPTKVGYLVWSKFPVRVYIEPPKIVNIQQAEDWVETVRMALQEWNVYLPNSIVEQPADADIAIIRKTPPLSGNPPRARSAQTSYELYTNNNVLSHRFSILLSPSQTGDYLTAAVRHEFGHALGIWGHSPLQSDALYKSQVRNPPPISARDVNTLKRVYEQPTNLGWAVSS